jgi:hypothetical protein
MEDINMEDINDHSDINAHRDNFNPTLLFISGMSYTFNKSIEYRQSFTCGDGFSFKKKTFITHTVIRNNALRLETIKRVIVCGQCNRLDDRWRKSHKEDCSCFQDFYENPYPVYCDGDSDGDY